MAATMLRQSRRLARPCAQIVERRAAAGLASTAAASREIPFPMPLTKGLPVGKVFPSPKAASSILSQLPLSAAPKKATPVLKVLPNLYAKLEGFNVGGSIKDRAVMQCTLGMLQNGKLKPGDTLSVCTSGNAGRSLLHVQDLLRQNGIAIHVKIFMPSRYLPRDVPSTIAETDGVDTVVGDRDQSFFAAPAQDTDTSRVLYGLDGEFMDVQGKMAVLAKELGWAVLDQHYDVNSLHAHKSTAEELMAQLPQITDVVCTTGTGGTASGLREYLPAHVTVHARPGKPGAIDGITDVRRYSNFCDPDLLEGYALGFFDSDDSVDHQLELQAEHNITAGPSSGAAFALAKDILDKNPEAHVVFICADGKSDKLPLPSW